MSGLHKSFYRYTAFLKEATVAAFTPPDELLQAWQRDGIFLRAFLLQQRRVQMVCASTATISPVQIAQRLKGRLNHCLRQQSPAYPGFDRDFFLGTLGQNDRDIVAAYIRNQVDHSDLVDPLYRERLKVLRFHEDPGQPPRGKHKGIHDHHLHIVLVTQGRYRMFPQEAKKVSVSIIEGGESVGMDIMEFSIMPDHAHILARPDHHRNPQQSLDDLKSASSQQLRRTRLRFPQFADSGGA